MKYAELTTCPQCHGECVIPNGDDCPRCGGHGEVVICYATRIGQREPHDRQTCSHYGGSS